MIADDGQPHLTNVSLNFLLDNCDEETRWMAPELFVDDALPTPESDVFAFGMLVVEVIGVLL